MSTSADSNSTIRLQRHLHRRWCHYDRFQAATMRDKLSGCSCTASFAMGLLQGKWRIEILVAMRSGPVRLGQLTRLIPAASKKVLTENLRKMEAAGLVGRADFTGTVRHVEYNLTEAIKSETYALLDEMERWAISFGNMTAVPEGDEGDLEL